MSEDFAHTWRRGDLLLQLLCWWRPLQWSVFRVGMLRGRYFLLLAGALPGRMIALRRSLFVPTARDWSNHAFPNRHNLWGWGTPLFHNHAAGAGACEVCVIEAFPRSGVFVRSAVFFLSEVRALSGVLDLSESGDWAQHDLTERSVLFLQTWDHRVLSKTRVFSRSGTLLDFGCFGDPADWLGPVPT